jgi:hypothetical protein
LLQAAGQPSLLPLVVKRPADQATPQGTTDSDILLRSGMVMAASVPKLVQFICSAAADRPTIVAFFMTYRSFTAPAVLLSQILARWSFLLEAGAPEAELAR